MARCPECGEKLQVPEDLERWDRFNCESCNAELEVLRLKPLELEAVYDFEEDQDLEDLDEDLEDVEDLDDLEWDDEDGDDEDDDEDDDDDDDDDW
jgi:lysine biosynthesis protein LysW